MKSKMTLVISKAVADLQPPFIWLGGGREDVKWFVHVTQLVNAFQTIVAPIDIASK